MPIPENEDIVYIPTHIRKDNVGRVHDKMQSCHPDLHGGIF